MWIWIVVAVVVLAGAVFAFWPRAKSVSDNDVRWRKGGGAQASNYDGMGPSGGGGL